MGTTTFQLIDLSGGYATLTFSMAETGNPTGSPPPSEIGEDVKREIAIHPIPTLDRDLGQDMGAHSRVYTLSGLCTLTDKNNMKTRSLAAQTTTSYPGGRWRFTMTSADSQTYQNITGLMIQSFSYMNARGLRGWFRYTLVLIEFYGQS